LILLIFVGAKLQKNFYNRGKKRTFALSYGKMTINDKDLGEIYFRRNERAKRYIIRISTTAAVSVTVPRYGSFREAEKFFYKERERVVQQYRILKARNDKQIADVPQYNETDLRRRAQQILPAMTATLAQTHGFQYQAVKIRKSKTRWGSCSLQKNISLSLYLMTLPEHLIRYVILHELCHTVEMNHGTAFWALLDKCTDGNARTLSRELQNFSVNQKT
jgi:predicted metal-dependent hydrolase